MSDVVSEASSAPSLSDVDDDDDDRHRVVAGPASSARSSRGPPPLKPASSSRLTSPPPESKPSPDVLDHAVDFLKTRDGMDKMLKLMRYAAALTALATTNAKLSKLERYTALTRKFLRLGRFLGNAKELRDLSRTSRRLSRLGATATAGGDDIARQRHRASVTVNNLAIACQGVQLAYNLLEQGNWATRTRLVTNERWKRTFSVGANYAELAVCFFSAQLHALALRDLDRRAREIADAMEARRRVAAAAAAKGAFAPRRRPWKKSDGVSYDELDDEVLDALLANVARERWTRRVNLAQDALDAAAVAGDVVGGGNAFQRPVVVGALGLLSAMFGAYDKWVATAPASE